MRRLSYKIYAQHYSIQELEDKGVQLADSSAELQLPHELLTVLTNRQKQVAELLEEGYSRKEVAVQLHVCVQAIHQIVLRIRKRLYDKAGVNKKHLAPRRLTEDTKNLIFMFILTNPSISVSIIYEVWDRHPLLKEYDKPTLQSLKRYIKTIR